MIKRGVSSWPCRSLLSFVIVSLFGCAGSQPRFSTKAHESKMIRVLLESVPDGARVQASGSFALQGEGGINVIRSERASEVLVRRNGNTLQIQLRPTGEVAAVEGNITIVPGRGADLKFAGVDYAGNIRLQPGGSGEIMVINDLLLETYLEGVLPHEIGNPGPEAYSALEAQAVAARTYAMMKIEQRSDQLFDVHSGVLDQVYRGKERQNQLTTAAVRETRGAVLTAGGKLCRTYYSATCGGHTSDIDFAWPTRESARYLHGVYDKSAANEGAYCSWVHNFRWRYSFSGKELGDILRRTLPDELGIAPESVGSVVDLKVVRRTPSGRVRVLEIETTRDNFRIESDRIRWVLKIDLERGLILPSTMFDMDITRVGDLVSFVSIYGGGNGHGVGMCQNGAIGMARRGYSYRMILSHYYPGTTVEERF